MVVPAFSNVLTGYHRVLLQVAAFYYAFLAHDILRVSRGRRSVDDQFFPYVWANFGPIEKNI